MKNKIFQKITIQSLILSLIFLSCGNPKDEYPAQKSLKIDSLQAERLAQLPLRCLQKEYPHSSNQVLNDATDLATPAQLHPAFYGCFDWHSAVHGHWTLAVLLRAFPNMPQKARIISTFKLNLTTENIQQEIEFFQRPSEIAFERPYGWAWLLQLQQELDSHPEPELRSLATNVRPLTKLLIKRYLTFLPKLNYPIRTGTHSNTAFGMNLAWDYATSIANEEFLDMLEEESRRFFSKDTQCPFAWEVSGTDFLSPCLEEMALMNRVLDKAEFLEWAKKFAPVLFQKDFVWEAAFQVSDRTDRYLVHMDGLNLSRAWNLYDLSSKHPELAHLKAIAEKHLLHSLPYITDDNYEGEHWLATFALKALMSK